ncbi:uncharacterized protein TNCV_4730491 [Trichonephila clavipes]|nr:uncharacterized protein TNCV_4730491 [Trichonephila clavipes]
MKDRILKLAKNVTDQQKNDINSAPFIPLCLDESIDITKSTRLAVFARYCVGNIIKEEGTDICTAVRNSLAEKEIDLKKIVSVTTNSTPNMTSHDVNLRITQAFSHIGKDYSAIEKFCMVMNIDPFSSTTYGKCARWLDNAYTLASENIFAEIHREIKNVYENAAEITDLSVSFDGTWLTRGHTSVIGVGCVIDMLTGYVVDFEVMSKVCRHCSVAKNKLGQSSAEFSIWYEGHKSECDINHLGSSTSMEMEAALTLWKRSTSLGFRYITVLSDGDCKTFNYLCEKKVYGPDIVIKKEECINHVSKRLGTALRSTVNDCRAQDAKPQHSKCPAGENSWYFYQSAIANGEKPNNHKLNVGTPINEKFLPKILPIYQRLASNELLERCIRCGTQNANESLHSMIWAKCPKEIFVNKRRVKRAVTEAVCEYNKGTVRTIVETQKALGVATGGSTKQLATILDCQKQKFRKRRQNVSNKLALKLIKKEAGRRAMLLARWIVRSEQLEIVGSSGYEKVPTRGKPGLGEDHEERGSKDRVASTCGPTVSRSTIRADVGVAIVPQTISRHLAEANLKSKRPFRALPLTPEHRQLRVQWCQARSMWNVTKGPFLNCLRGAIFQQDNARPHTARVAQDFLRHFQTLPWPARSPNLSPVEHVWDQLKRQMPSCHSSQDLELAVQELWMHLPQDNIRCLINSMPDRVAACIAAGGSPTRY